MAFAGFDPKAIDMLQKLPGFDGEQYAANKGFLKEGLLLPGGDLIEEVAMRLDADLTVVRRSSVSPLHSDLRFAKPGTPRYKDHLLLTTWSGHDKKTAPILWLRIDSGGIGFASGMGFDPKNRARWREAVGGDVGESLSKAVAKLNRGTNRSRSEYAGAQLKKVPGPWPADHPREDLLRMNAFQVRFMEPLPSSVGKPAFAGWCATRLKRLLPIHEWLLNHVVG